MKYSMKMPKHKMLATCCHAVGDVQRAVAAAAEASAASPASRLWIPRNSPCFAHTRALAEEAETAVELGHLASHLACTTDLPPHLNLTIAHLNKRYGRTQDRPFLHSLLVEIYGKSGYARHARLLFDLMPTRPKLAWKAIIRAHAQAGQFSEAFHLWNRLSQEGSTPDMFTFVSILTAFGGLLDASNGRRIHALVVCNEFVSDGAIGTALVNMYGKCGSLNEAVQAFDGIDEPSTMAWNVVMAVRSKLYERGGAADSLLLQDMQERGVFPDRVSFINILSMHRVEDHHHGHSGERIHVQVLSQGIHTNVALGNALINMYAVSGKLHEAHRAFDDILDPDMISWTSILQGHGRSGACPCLGHFERMKQEAILPDRVAYMVVVEACTDASAMADGKRAHACLVAMGIASNTEVGTALVQMYGHCGHLKGAFSLFEELPRKNVVSWTSLMALQNHNGQGREAIRSFCSMLQAGAMPDKAVYLCAIDACGQIGDPSECKRMYTHLLADGYEPESSALMSLYLRQWPIGEDILQELDGMLALDVSSWNLMIIACNEHGCGSKALRLFYQMQQEGVVPNEATFAMILNSGDGLINVKRIHAQSAASLVKGGAVLVASSLVGMYGKCGDIEGAQMAFNEALKHSSVTGTTLLSVYAQHGDMCKATQILNQYTADDILLMGDAVFVTALSSCSRAGSFDEGVACFRRMMKLGTRKPGLDHYCSIIDLLGRAGNLVDAQAFIDAMPCQPSRVLWMALLSACRYQADAERGRCVAQHVFELNPMHLGSYAMLSNIYAMIGNLIWDTSI
jgi:pentatricopeptide repeat protein